MLALKDRLIQMRKGIPVLRSVDFNFEDRLKPYDGDIDLYEPQKTLPPKRKGEYDLGR